MLSDDDAGSITVLIIGYTFIGAVLIVVGVDVSKVFLAQRALSSAADAAALAGAQAVDRAAVYRGASVCGALPVDASMATAAVDATLEDAVQGLDRTFAAVSDPDVEVSADTVHVHLRGQVTVPFGRVLALLLPSRADSGVSVAADAAATTAVASPSC